MRLFLLVFVLLAVGFLVSCERQISDEAETLVEHMHSLDGEIETLLQQAVERNMTLESSLQHVGTSLLLFDGRDWDKDAQSEFFNLHLLGVNKEANWLNRAGDYLVWKLPSSENDTGRIKGVGIRRHEGRSSAFFVEVEVFSVER